MDGTARTVGRCLSGASIASGMRGMRGMRGLLALVVGLLLSVAPAPAFANHKSHMVNETSPSSDDGAKPRYHPNRVLVTFKATAYSSVSGGEAELGIRPLRRWGSDGDATKATVMASKSADSDWRAVMQAYEIADGMSVGEKVAQLAARRDVAIAEPDYAVKLYRIPSDPLVSSQWHHAVMRTRAAWDYGTGSSDVKVCVIDSGASAGHPDLAGNILKGWNVAPDGNRQYAMPGSEAWKNYNDTLGHGTHVTGLIAAVGDNAEGVSGVSWRAGVLSCRFISDSGSGYISDAVTCIRLCREEGAHVYSNSWGGVGYSETLLQEIQKLNEAGALFVVAAGNNNMLNLDSTPLYPASYKVDNVITVASTTSKNQLSSFSNIGTGTVHVAAPGSTVYSTTVDGSYGSMSGTSMSAPIVSGLAALLKGVAMNEGYELSANELRDIIVKSAVPFAGGTRYTASGGRVDSLAAVRLLKAKIKMSEMVKNADQGGGVDAPSSTTPPSSSTTAPSPSFAPPTQSSTYGSRVASYALSASGYNARKYPKACSMTDPKRSRAWWTVQNGATNVNVSSVSITSRGDCCWNDLGGAKVMVGDTPWTGSGSAKRFKTCGVIKEGDVVRGGQGVNEVTCAAGVSGKYLAIYLPKKRTSLMLCGVKWSS